MSSPEKLPFEDLKHFADSFWRNEEIGEKRFNFLVTLITAVAGGIATLQVSTTLPSHVDRQMITAWAVAGLLLISVMTYFRMLQRIKVRKEFHDTLRYIRRELVRLEQGPADYHVPRKPDDEPPKPRTGCFPLDRRKALRVLFKGGFAILVSLINAVLVGVLIYVVLANILGGSWGPGTFWAALGGVATFISFWIGVACVESGP